MRHENEITRSTGYVSFFYGVDYPIVGTKESLKRYIENFSAWHLNKFRRKIKKEVIEEIERVNI